jgi:biopolymer transport protein ExbB
MTALGLLVAVPAVLAYNYLQARNKRIAEEMRGFATDVLANINSKGAVRPAVMAPAAGAKPAAAPAKA